MAITDKKIILHQLDNELGSHGLIANFNNSLAKIILPADGSPLSEEELEIGIKNHIPIDDQKIQNDAKESAQAKLASLGLTPEEIAALSK